MLATALRVFRGELRVFRRECLGESYEWSFYAGHCIKSV